MKVVKTHPEQRGRSLRAIFALLSAPSPAVQFEAAVTLMSLSSAPTAIKAAANCLLQLLVKVSATNIKLVVLDRLLDLRKSHGMLHLRRLWKPLCAHSDCR